MLERAPKWGLQAPVSFWYMTLLKWRLPASPSPEESYLPTIALRSPQWSTGWSDLYYFKCLPLHYHSKNVKFCIHYVRVMFLFPKASTYSIYKPHRHQISMFWRLFFLCRTPRIESLIWGLDRLLLRENFRNVIKWLFFFLWVTCLGYKIGLYCIYSLLLTLLKFFIFLFWKIYFPIYRLFS